MKMENSRTPYGCTICKEEFNNPILLVKHVELIHPPKEESKNINIATSETVFCDDNQDNLSNFECNQNDNDIDPFKEIEEDIG